MSTATQTELKILPVRNSLRALKRDGVLGALGLDPWQLAPLTELGKIRGVVNVASKDAADDLRWVPTCVEEYRLASKRNEEPPERTIADLMWLLFGMQRPLISGALFYRRLNIRHGHFYDLLRERQLHRSHGSEEQTGPGGSVKMEWSEVEGFITKRRVA